MATPEDAAFAEILAKSKVAQTAPPSGQSPEDVAFAEILAKSKAAKTTPPSVPSPVPLAKPGSFIGFTALQRRPEANLAGLTADARGILQQADHSLAAAGHKGWVTSAKRSGVIPSAHNAGEAADLAFPGQDMPAIAQELQRQGFRAQFERKGQRNPNGSIATGDHVHVTLRGRQAVVASPEDTAFAEILAKSKAAPTAPAAPVKTPPAARPRQINIEARVKAHPAKPWRKVAAETLGGAGAALTAPYRAAVAFTNELARRQATISGEKGPVAERLARDVAAAARHAGVQTMRGVMEQPEILKTLLHQRPETTNPNLYGATSVIDTLGSFLLDPTGAIYGPAFRIGGKVLGGAARKLVEPATSALSKYHAGQIAMEKAAGLARRAATLAETKVGIGSAAKAAAAKREVILRGRQEALGQARQAQEAARAASLGKQITQAEANVTAHRQTVAGLKVTAGKARELRKVGNQLYVDPVKTGILRDTERLGRIRAARGWTLLERQQAELDRLRGRLARVKSPVPIKAALEPLGKGRLAKAQKSYNIGRTKYSQPAWRARQLEASVSQQQAAMNATVQDIEAAEKLQKGVTDQLKKYTAGGVGPASRRTLRNQEHFANQQLTKAERKLAIHEENLRRLRTQHAAATTMAGGAVPAATAGLKASSAERAAAAAQKRVTEAQTKAAAQGVQAARAGAKASTLAAAVEQVQGFAPKTLTEKAVVAGAKAYERHVAPIVEKPGVQKAGALLGVGPSGKAMRETFMPAGIALAHAQSKLGHVVQQMRNYERDLALSSPAYEASRLAYSTSEAAKGEVSPFQVLVKRMLRSDTGRLAEKNPRVLDIPLATAPRAKRRDIYSTRDLLQFAHEHHVPWEKAKHFAEEMNAQFNAGVEHLRETGARPFTPHGKRTFMYGAITTQRTPAQIAEREMGLRRAHLGKFLTQTFGFQAGTTMLGQVGADVFAGAKTHLLQRGNLRDIMNRLIDEGKYVKDVGPEGVKPGFTLVPAVGTPSRVYGKLQGKQVYTSILREIEGRAKQAGFGETKTGRALAGASTLEEAARTQGALVPLQVASIVKKGKVSGFATLMRNAGQVGVGGGLGAVIHGRPVSEFMRHLPAAAREMLAERRGLNVSQAISDIEQRSRTLSGMPTQYVGAGGKTAAEVAGVTGKIVTVGKKRILLPGVKQTARALGNSFVTANELTDRIAKIALYKTLAPHIGKDAAIKAVETFLFNPTERSVAGRWLDITGVAPFNYYLTQGAKLAAKAAVIRPDIIAREEAYRHQLTRALGGNPMELRSLQGPQGQRPSTLGLVGAKGHRAFDIAGFTPARDVIDVYRMVTGTMQEPSGEILSKSLWRPVIEAIVNTKIGYGVPGSRPVSPIGAEPSRQAKERAQHGALGMAPPLATGILKYVHAVQGVGTPGRYGQPERPSDVIMKYLIGVPVISTDPAEQRRLLRTDLGIRFRNAVKEFWRMQANKANFVNGQMTSGARRELAKQHVYLERLKDQLNAVPRPEQ